MGQGDAGCRSCAVVSERAYWRKSFSLKGSFVASAVWKSRSFQVMRRVGVVQLLFAVVVVAIVNAVWYVCNDCEMVTRRSD